MLPVTKLSAICNNGFLTNQPVVFFLIIVNEYFVCVPESDLKMELVISWTETLPVHLYSLFPSTNCLPFTK